MSTPQKAIAGDAAAGGGGLFATPHRSLLKGGPARRVLDSATKAGDDVRGFVSRGLDHLTMFERVQQLEVEKEALRVQIGSLKSDRQELLEQLQRMQEAYEASRHGVGHASSCVVDGEGEAGLRTQLEQLKQELLTEQQERRKAHNALVDLRGNVSGCNSSQCAPADAI